MSEYFKIDETKLNLDNYLFSRLDEVTSTIMFDALYEYKNNFYTFYEVDKIDGFDINDDENKCTPMVEYWFDENKWRFVLLYEYDAVKWDISKELELKIKKIMAESLCTYRETGCSDCEFNQATGMRCPLGKDD